MDTASFFKSIQVMTEAFKALVEKFTVLEKDIHSPKKSVFL